jgi:hypothetical protein
MTAIMMTPAFTDHNAIAMMATPTFMVATITVGFLDDDGFRAGRIGRDRQSDAEGGQSGESEQGLAHAKFSSDLNDASTREGALAFQIMF